jgi:integrase
MARPHSTHPDLPPRLRARVKGGVTYYSYDTGGKPRREVALGTNRLEAFRRWAELERAACPPEGRATMADVVTRYRKEVLPAKALKTQREQTAQLGTLLKFFNDPPAPLAAILPLHVRQYLDWRRATPVAANRERALLSHLWNMAREWGYTDRPNPCAGITGHRERGRADKLPSAEVIAAVRAAACAPLRDALDLAFLTGQRPADVLALSITHIKGGELWIRQRKTGQALRIAIEGDLAALLARIQPRRTRSTTLALLVDEHGRALSQHALRYRFDQARTKALKAHPELPAIVEFQFRDLRAAAGTEVALLRGKDSAQTLLGHASVTTTERYVRARAGQRAKPTR